MKRTIQILTAFFLTSTLLTSCMFSGPSINGNGDVKTEKLKTGDFDEIKVSRGMNVYITQGDETKVVVKADENLLDIIETKVEDGALIIRATENIRKATVKKVYVTTPDISLIKSSSGSNVYSETVLKSEHLDISSSSGSNIKLLISVGSVDASSSSGSNIRLEGKADNFDGDASSGSNIKAKELKSKSCKVEASSGANIWISVKENLKAHASSGGNIFYKGSLSNAEIKKSSGGNVKKD
jgi:hypothetical protein